MTTPAFVIRPARPQDLEAMTWLLARLFSLEEDFAIDPAKQEQGLRLMLDNPSGRLWVAQAQGRVVGMVSAQRLISTAEGGPAILVEDLVVEDSWQGRGLGRALLEAVEEWAGQQGARRLQLLADAGNRPALEFYLHLGWQGTRLVCLRSTKD